MEQPPRHRFSRRHRTGRIRPLEDGITTQRVRHFDWVSSPLETAVPQDLEPFFAIEHDLEMLQPVPSKPYLFVILLLLWPPRHF